jgi:hypothetical protein
MVSMRNNDAVAEKEKNNFTQIPRFFEGPKRRTFPKSELGIV